jgi:hypothetical protein
VRAELCPSCSPLISFLESVHGRKLRSTGEFSLKTFCRFQTTYFENFPMDGDGRSIRLVEFESMQDDHLVIWRDHLIASFSQHPPQNSFRFRTSEGRLPQLTVLKLGKDIPKSSSGKKKKGRNIKDQKKKQLSKAKQKRNKRRSKVDGLESEGERSMSEEERSMSDGSETYSEDDEDGVPRLPPRTKIPRKSAENAASSIGHHIRKEARFEDEQVNRKKLKGKKSVSRLPVHAMDLAEGEEELMEMRSAMTVEPETEPNYFDASSLCLQTKEMVTSTLLNSWKKQDFDPRNVSFWFSCVHGVVFVKNHAFKSAHIDYILGKPNSQGSIRKFISY